MFARGFVQLMVFVKLFVPFQCICHFVKNISELFRFGSCFCQFGQKYNRSIRSFPRFFVARKFRTSGTPTPQRLFCFSTVQIYISGKNLDFLKKIEILTKIWIYEKIEILTKIWISEIFFWNFNKSLIFWSKFGFLTKICICDKNWNFDNKLDLSQKL